MDFKTYLWKESSRYSNIPAQVFGELVESLAEDNGGVVPPEQIVDAARPPDSPIHSMFEWEDSIAAENWRRAEARQAVCSIVVKVETKPQQDVQIRAFVNVVQNQQRGYATTAMVLSDTVLRTQLLDACRRDAKIFRDKYSHLREVAAVVDEIDRFLGEPHPIALSEHVVEFPAAELIEA